MPRSTFGGRFTRPYPVIAAIIFGACSWAAAEPSSQQEASDSPSRIERIREKLVDRAMEAPVRVSSSAWVDESGRFRHVTRLYSDLRARALKDLESPGERHTEAAAGEVSTTRQPAARPEGRRAPSRGEAAGAPQVERANGAEGGTARDNPAEGQPAAGRPADGKSAADCPVPAGPLRRFAQVRTEIRPDEGSHGRAMLVHLAERIQSELLRQSRAVATVQPVVADAMPRSSYDYRLANDGGFDLPYWLDLELRSTGAIDHSLKPGERLASRDIMLTLSLVERATNLTLVSRSYPMTLSGMTPVVGLPDFSRHLEPDIRQSIVEWIKSSEALVRCEPMRVQGIFEANALVQIPVGVGAGVRVGDRWLLSDSARVPARVLERGVLEGMRVAEVVSVSRHRAMLRLESSSGHTSNAVSSDRGVQWVAVPL